MAETKCAVCAVAIKLGLKNAGKNKKHKRGNECRLTRCSFVISFLCVRPPMKMDYFFLVLSQQFVVVGSLFTLAAKGSKLNTGRDIGSVSVFANRMVIGSLKYHFSLSSRHWL